jgi:hypothetical protein
MKLFETHSHTNTHQIIQLARPIDGWCGSTGSASGLVSSHTYIEKYAPSDANADTHTGRPWMNTIPKMI